MVNLRHIALCNVLYKVITKVIANRMKSIMDITVAENQSAFIPRWLIFDNIMVSFEILHKLKKKAERERKIYGFETPHEQSVRSH